MLKDITAWQLVDGYVVPQYEDGNFVDGTFDVLQRVLMVLLTETDSCKFTFGRDVQRACPFMSAWRRGEIYNESDVLRIFSLCQPAIQHAMQSQEQPDDTPAQRFKSLTLERIYIVPGRIDLECVLKTYADTVRFKLPMPV